MCYNAYGSPLETQFTGGYTQYTYNTNNLLLDVTHKDDLLSANTYRYDAYGFVNKESTFLVEFDPNFIISTSIAEYTYDANGNRKTLKLTDDNGAVVTQATYTYDNLDRLTSVCADGITADYTYNDNGQLLTEATSDNTAAYSYNRAGLVTALTNTNGADYTYAYQLDGNQIQKTDSVNGTATYTYDTLGQLKSETASGNTTSYTYDSRGNRISMNNGGIISQYTYDANNRLLTQVAKIGEQTEYHTSYSYDNNGSLLLKNTAAYMDISSSDSSSLTLQVPESIAKNSVKDSMLVMYTYNSLNQLTKVESDDAVPISYLYDATGRRIRKTVGDAVTNHVWDGQNIVYESDGSNNQIAKYIRGNKLIAQVTDGKTSYYTYDAHGSVTGMDGVTYTYDAFGNLQNDMDTHNPFRYSGEYYDTETDMIYLRNRYYAPSVGRFITEDPAEDGLNWYVYCGNNPVMFVDPLGLKAKGEVFGIYSTNTRDIKMLQNKLNSLGYVGTNGRALSVDGVFGENTLYAVKNFQQKNGLTVDGLVGDDTWGKLQLDFDVDYNEVYGPEKYYDPSNDSVTVIPAWQQVSATTILLAPAIKAGIMAMVAKPTIVLGSYPMYIEKAKEIGAKFFQVPMDTWNKLTSDQQWELNVEFLRKGIERSATFIVEAGSSIKENSFLYKEIDFLLKNGYQWLEDFSALIKR